jgi:hypothetical protein
MQKQQIINFFAWTFVSIVGLLVGTVVLVMVLGVSQCIHILGSSQNLTSGWPPNPDFLIGLTWQKYKREDLDVEIYYYTPPFGKTNFIAYLIGPPPERKKLEKKYGVEKWHPGSKKKYYAKDDHYPNFNIVTVDGVTELIEHRHMAPIFHVSDDPEMKRYIK